jgi:(d)CTP diphosphatase
MNHILKQIFTLSTVLAIFVLYILMQNYLPSNKQSIAVAIIEKNDKVLLTLQSQEKNPQNLWAFPMQTTKKNENLIDCLKQELQAELNFKAEAAHYIGTTNATEQDQELELHAFRVPSYSGQIILKDKYIDAVWLHPQELSNYQIVKNQLPFVKLLQEN